MTTPEPMPGRTTAPFISVAADRMYQRLPRIYKILDAQNGWAFKRYLAGATSFAGELDDMIESLRGSRTVGPIRTTPWDLDAEDAARWSEARRDVNSALTDPDLARPEWLPYIAQMVGARLDPQASLAERRDTIRFATSGYRAGTTAAIADAARSALTGSRYVLVQPFTRPDAVAATVWDVTLRTRTSETPSQQAVLDTVIRKGAKPAGVRLWVGSFGTSWDRVEATFPTWTEWEAHTWDEIEESGATYATPENMAPGPSMEAAADIAKWTPLAQGGGSVPTFALSTANGVDGANSGRLTKVGATGGMQLQSVVVTDARVLASRSYIFSLSVKSSVVVPVTLQIDWQTSAGAAISSTTAVMGSTTAGAWTRLTSQQASPATAARARLNVIVTGTVAAGVTVDVDAVMFRIITTGGG